MSCCAGLEYRETTGTCPDCTADIDSDGESTEQCGYSPTMCTTCYDAPCDGSC